MPFNRLAEENYKSTLLRWASLAGLVLHFPGHLAAPQLWRVNSGSPVLPGHPVDLAIKVVSNQADADYTNVLLAGWGYVWWGVVLLVGTNAKRKL